MRKLFSIFLFALFLNAEVDNRLIIDSEKFESFDKEGILIFTKNVKMKKAQDRLNADKVTVYLNTPKSKDEKREAIKYVAVGNVTFKVVSDGTEYEGSGNEVIYMPKELQYEIIGNGYLKDITTNKTLIGNNIFINQKSGDALVEGSENKPVRFIFDVEEKNEKDN